MSLSTTVAGIAFYRVYDTVLDPFDDTSMIRKTVLRTGAAFVIPVEEDNHSGRRFNGVVSPLISLLEPVHSVDAYIRTDLRTRKQSRRTTQHGN